VDDRRSSGMVDVGPTIHNLLRSLGIRDDDEFPLSVISGMFRSKK